MPLQPEDNVTGCGGCQRNYPVDEVVHGLCPDCWEEANKITSRCYVEYFE